MLTDTALKNLKPKTALYKVTDRDGMYVTVSPVGTVTFRYDYRMNGRRETLTIGRYGADGLSLARARERCIDARRAVYDGKSPAQEKQREKRRLSEAKNFQEFTDRWAKGARMADSTRSMRKSILDRDILPVFKNRLLTEITSDDLPDLCNKVKGRGPRPRPSTCETSSSKSMGLPSCTARRSSTRPMTSGRPRSRPSCRKTAPCRPSKSD